MRILQVSSGTNRLRRSTFRGGESVIASRRLANRDEIPHHTDLGKGPLFLIYCLSARTVREYAHPTSDRLQFFLSYRESKSHSTRYVEEPQPSSKHQSNHRTMRCARAKYSPKEDAGIDSPKAPRRSRIHRFQAAPRRHSRASRGASILIRSSTFESLGSLRISTSPIPPSRVLIIATESRETR